MAVGLLESFELIEQYGGTAVRAGVIDAGDLMDAANSKRKFGCRLLKSGMTQDEKVNVMRIGGILKAWRK